MNKSSLSEAGGNRVESGRHSQEHMPSISVLDSNCSFDTNLMFNINENFRDLPANGTKLTKTP